MTTGTPTAEKYKCMNIFLASYRRGVCVCVSSKAGDIEEAFPSKRGARVSATIATEANCRVLCIGGSLGRFRGTDSHGDTFIHHFSVLVPLHAVWYVYFYTISPLVGP